MDTDLHTRPNEGITCGQRFAALVEHLYPTSGDGHALFKDAPGHHAFAAHALGFQHGQAEKVASGACAAFMIRPAPQWRAWTVQAMTCVCAHYGLVVVYDQRHGEIWGATPAGATRLKEVLSLEVNSPAWHRGRASLCGIPPSDVDIHYHTRQSYRTRCEPSDVNPFLAL